MTAAEEKTLARLVRRMLAMEEKKEEVVGRLQRDISEKEWAAECGFPDLQSFRKAIKVRNAVKEVLAVYHTGVRSTVQCRVVPGAERARFLGDTCSCNRAAPVLSLPGMGLECGPSMA